MRIYLVGYMGSGKTTVGRRLANALEWQFIDMDHYIEKQQNKSILEIFNEEGEDTFRKLEQQAIKDSFSWQKTIISTGGGTPCFNNNMDLLINNGLCFYLYMPAKALADRLKQSKKQRPLLEHISPMELDDFIKTNLQKREAFYFRSHFTIDVLNPYSIQILMNRIKEHYNII